MDSVIRRMLVNVYELEGVLLLAQERGDATPETVLSIIKEKAELLLDDASSLSLEEPFETRGQDAFSIEDRAETVAEENLLQDVVVEEEGEVAIGNANAHDSEASAAVASTMEKIRLFQEREQEEDEPKPMSFSNEVVSDADDVEEVEVEESQQEEDAAVPEFDEPVKEEYEVVEEEPSFDSKDDFVEIEDIVEDMPEELEDEEITAEESYEQTSHNINIEDAYIRHKSKDLRSAFSINDTFRFRRELFGNSAADMSDAINLVIAMNSFEEAEDYFYGDLRWDSESDEVKEFMEIIRNHFL